MTRRGGSVAGDVTRRGPRLAPISRCSTVRARSITATSRLRSPCGRFCAASARFISGDLPGNTTADAILRALRKAGASGMARTEISKVFGFNRRSGILRRRWSCWSRPGKRGASRLTGTPRQRAGA